MDPGEQMQRRETLPHLDVCVEDSAPWGGVLALMQALRPHWDPARIQLKFFTEGITNLLMGCWVEGPVGPVETVLVRVYGRHTERLVDRARERATLQLLQAHGCGPRLYCSFTNGLCYQYLSGRVLEDRLLREPAVYRLIAAEMARIHSIPRSGSPAQPVLWEKVSGFLQLVQTAETKPPGPEGTLPGLPGLHVLQREMEALRQHLTHVSSPIVLCHNDLLTKNIIYNQPEGSVRFIDYEYADYNYQAFDIGNHFNEFAGVETVDPSLYPSVGLQRDWLATYLRSYKQALGLSTGVSDQELQGLYVRVCKFSLVSHFLWGLWALLQARYSTIDFDFLRYALARFDFYFEKKEEYFAMKLPD
ncbi:ethanolamine kinase 1-like [Conger conger]|uniref:ethanolamine kinase 1-like n=1 Tax=Conger conger TaxID=82655 RepID=UPI002A5A978A|nr:ethanolamine kinase 1-like [Conger conger]